MSKKQAREILKRVLTLIDILAPYSKGVRATELYEKLVHKHGQTAMSTMYRDLDALHSLGYVKKIRITNAAGDNRKAYLYKLDVKRTEHFQEMAISLCN